MNMHRLLLYPTFFMTTILCGQSKQPSFIDCSGLKTQMELTECEGRNFQIADSLLDGINADVFRRLAVLKGRTKKDDDSTQTKYVGELERTFIKSMDKWKTYRDAYSKIYEDRYAGGSMQSMVVTECMTRLTVEHTEELKLLLKDLNH